MLIRSDSYSAVQAFANNNIPWFVRQLSYAAYTTGLS